MENNNKKGISKRTLRTKIILLVILAVIMVPLIILYKSVGDTTPKIKLYDRNQTENSSENQEAQTTEPQTEPQTEPVSEEPQAVPETKTAEKKPATIIPITDEEKWKREKRILCSLFSWNLTFLFFKKNKDKNSE